MNHYVYQIISLTPDENGVLKIYSGLRSCECEPEEDDYMGSGHAITNAINKYGRDKFLKMIIGKFDTREEAHECETKWLDKQFNFHGRDWKRFKMFNYNLRLNEGSHDGFACSPETREKLSEANSGENHPNFGKKLSDETKQKISAANSGENHPNFGKKLSDEHKKKMSAAKIGKFDGEQNPQFKGLSIGTNKNNQTIVFCGEKDIKSRGFNPGSISSVTNGKKPHHKGFVFIRTTDINQLKELLNTATFYDDVSRQRIEEFIKQ